MAEYVYQNFENHPAISAECVKFLATNYGFEKVREDGVRGRPSDLKEKL